MSGSCFTARTRISNFGSLAFFALNRMRPMPRFARACQVFRCPLRVNRLRASFCALRLFNQYDLYSKDHATTDPRSKRGHGFSTATSSEEKGSHRLWPGGVRREVAEVDPYGRFVRWLANKPSTSGCVDYSGAPRNTRPVDPKIGFIVALFDSRVAMQVHRLPTDCRLTAARVYRRNA